MGAGFVCHYEEAYVKIDSGPTILEIGDSSKIMSCSTFRVKASRAIVRTEVGFDVGSYRGPYQSPYAAPMPFGLTRNDDSSLQFAYVADSGNLQCRNTFTVSSLALLQLLASAGLTDMCICIICMLTVMFAHAKGVGWVVVVAPCSFVSQSEPQQPAGNVLCSF